MSIRKHGSATGEVTEVEVPEGITATASAAQEWTPGDEQGLAREDAAGDAPE
ncbi:MAG TPA: hypothetical protein VIG41_09470 [Micrococcaceae bacterium]|jgi:hypothetical protein